MLLRQSIPQDATATGGLMQNEVAGGASLQLLFIVDYTAQRPDGNGDGTVTAEIDFRSLSSSSVQRSRLRAKGAMGGKERIPVLWPRRGAMRRRSSERQERVQAFTRKDIPVRKINEAERVWKVRKAVGRDFRARIAKQAAGERLRYKLASLGTSRRATAVIQAGIDPEAPAADHPLEASEASGRLKPSAIRRRLSRNPASSFLLFFSPSCKPPTPSTSYAYNSHLDTRRHRPDLLECTTRILAADEDYTPMEPTHTISTRTIATAERRHPSNDKTAAGHDRPKRGRAAGRLATGSTQFPSTASAWTNNAWTNNAWTSWKFGASASLGRWMGFAFGFQSHALLPIAPIAKSEASQGPQAPSCRAGSVPISVVALGMDLATSGPLAPLEPKVTKPQGAPAVGAHIQIHRGPHSQPHNYEYATKQQPRSAPSNHSFAPPFTLPNHQHDALKHAFPLLSPLLIFSQSLERVCHGSLVHFHTSVDDHDHELIITATASRDGKSPTHLPTMIHVFLESGTAET
ncbi:hypothetical protein G7046_g5346 [Stylonectria norvegica]|nr:hypothetical protein G7046_g5346 [Stylonectria norvegica]